MAKKRSVRKPAPSAALRRALKRKAPSQPLAVRREELRERLDALRPSLPSAARRSDMLERLLALVPDRPTRSRSRRPRRRNDAR
jgi:hypothetical protein